MKYRKTRFHGELRFVWFANYAISDTENYGPVIMVYTPEAWAKSEDPHQNNPGPIGFIPLSKLPNPVGST